MAQAAIRAFERPSVTSLTARAGEFLLNRSDFPPESPRPGLPADDIDFNFVLLTALFALQPRFFEGRVLLRLVAGLAVLFLVHVAALVFPVQSVYALNVGQWSAEHRQPRGPQHLAGGFHSI